MNPNSKITTYENQAELNVTDTDRSYRVVTWPEGDQIFAQVEEDDEIVAGCRTISDEIDRWALVDFLNRIFMRERSPTFLAEDVLRRIAGDVAKYQRSLLA